MVLEIRYYTMNISLNSHVFWDTLLLNKFQNGADIQPLIMHSLISHNYDLLTDHV